MNRAKVDTPFPCDTKSGPANGLLGNQRGWLTVHLLSDGRDSPSQVGKLHFSGQQKKPRIRGPARAAIV